MGFVGKRLKTCSSVQLLLFTAHQHISRPAKTNLTSSELWVIYFESDETKIIVFITNLRKLNKVVCFFLVIDG